MNEKIAIETFGNLTKEENIVDLKNNIKKGTSVVEQLDAYPGYHHADPHHAKIGHIFLLLKEPIEVMDLMRISAKIEKYIDSKLDAVAGEVIFDNKIHPCIRIRNIKNYERIAELQEWYSDAGIQFARAKDINTYAIIKLKKPFFIEEVAEGIYHDLDDLNLWYLQINDEINWSLFKKITQVVKNNLSDLNFDAALTGLYRKFGFIDAIRIYTEDGSVANLKRILDTYIMVCKKYL